MQTIAYGPHRQHVMDLAMPEEPVRLRPHGRRGPSAPHPVAFVLHGGFWRARYKRALMEGVCADLVARGWATVNVEYRRLGRFTGGGGGVPETLDDVAAALDHLAALPAPLDLDRVVSIGHSAGGHLALWVAAERGGARVRCAGAVGQAAVSDLERAAELGLGGGIVRQLCGGGPEHVPEQYRRASPAAHLPLGAPQLLVHGERDDIVPASVSVGYAAAARAGGDDVELVLRPEDGHFEHIDPGSGAWEAVTAWMTRFTR